MVCTDVYVSIVIPVFNEEANIRPLFESLKHALNAIHGGYEIIFVDDGSTDATFSVLKKLKEEGGILKIIKFSRNFGQTAAMTAGFDYAKGRIIIPMDGDLQNDPKDIPMLLEKIEEGFDVVSGWRRKRKDTFVTRKIPSFIANRLISIITGVKLHDYGCTLKAYKADVLHGIRLYGEMHRFIPALASWRGASICEVEVNHLSRKHGKGKYGLSRTLKVILDLMTVKFLLSYFTRPIQVFGFWGVIAILSGFISVIVLVLMKILHGINMTGNPFLYLAILLEIIGVQFIVLGLLGEINIRTYYESQNKSIYVVREIIE